MNILLDLFFTFNFCLIIWMGLIFYNSFIPVYQSSDKYINLLLVVMGLIIVAMLVSAMIIEFK